MGGPPVGGPAGAAGYPPGSSVGGGGLYPAGAGGAVGGVSISDSAAAKELEAAGGELKISPLSKLVIYGVEKNIALS